MEPDQLDNKIEEVLRTLSIMRQEGSDLYVRDLRLGERIDDLKQFSTQLAANSKASAADALKQDRRIYQYMRFTYLSIVVLIVCSLLGINYSRQLNNHRGLYQPSSLSSTFITSFIEVVASVAILGAASTGVVYSSKAYTTHRKNDHDAE